MKRSILIKLLVFCILQSLYFSSLEYYSKTQRFSYFFKPDLPAYHNLQQQRTSFSLSVLDSLSSSPLDPLPSASPNKFCIAVLSTDARLDSHYLLSSIASLIALGGVGQDSRTARFFINLRSTAAAPSHPDLDLLRAAGISVQITPSTKNKSLKWQENEIRDYVEALRSCLDSTSTHVVLIEEDTFAATHFLDKLDAAVSSLDEKAARGSSYTLLKLFVTDFWAGFERTLYDAFLLIFGGLLFGTLCYLLFFLLLPKLLEAPPATLPLLQTPAQTRLATLTNVFRVLAFAYFVTVGIVSMLALEKQALGLASMSSKGVYQNDIGASTLGMV